MKKKGFISVLLVMILTFLPSFNCFASSNDVSEVSDDGKMLVVTRVAEENTDDKNMFSNFDFADKVYFENKTYELSDVDYPIIESKYEQLDKEIKTEIVKTEIASSTDSLKADKTLSEDGYQYVLTNTQEDFDSYEPIYLYKEEISEITANEPVHKNSISYDYELPDGSIKTVELPYESTHVSTGGWASGYEFTGTVTGYDADYWKIGGENIKSSDSLSLSDSAIKTLITESGDDPQYYKDFSVAFNSEPYTNSEGVICRDYVVNCSYYGNKYVVRYGKTFEDLLPIYKYKLTYELTNDSKEEIETLKNTFVVTGKATYSLTEDKTASDNRKTGWESLSTPQKVAISFGVVLGIVLIISLILYLMKGGRKSTDYRSRRDSRDDFKKL